MTQEAYEKYQDCIAACHACAVECNHCAACCLQEPEVKQLVRCIGLDLDCVQMCQLAVAFMAGGSEHAAPACRLCAEICQTCGEECATHDMDHCQRCAEACKRCADECRKMAAMA